MFYLLTFDFLEEDPGCILPEPCHAKTGLEVFQTTQNTGLLFDFTSGQKKSIVELITASVGCGTPQNGVSVLSLIHEERQPIRAVLA